MTAAEIEELIEEMLAILPERMEGGEANRIVAENIVDLVASDREALVCCLRKLLSFRIRGRQRTGADALPEARIFTALKITQTYNLSELCPDIEALISDISKGLIFMPAHKSMVVGYLNRVTRQ